MQAEDRDRINEQVKARQFELGARLPISWKATAIGLKHAADRLYNLYYAASLRTLTREAKRIVSTKQNPARVRTLKGKELEDHYDSQLLPVYFLISGYALENLLKGILVLKHPEYLKTKSKLKDIRSHDLNQLCKRCDLHIKTKEATLLDKLTRHVEWQGKYPIPLELGKMLPLKQHNGEWIYRGEAFNGRQVQQEVDDLYHRFWKEFESVQSSLSASAPLNED